MSLRVHAVAFSGHTCDRNPPRPTSSSTVVVTCALTGSTRPCSKWVYPGHGRRPLSGEALQRLSHKPLM